MTCRAAVLHRMGADLSYVQLGPITIEEIELDHSRVGEVFGKIEPAGLCHFALSVVYDSRPLLTVIGYDPTDVVEHVEPNVANYA
jgi:Zn-dependent alcohol dehydrogenase